MVERPVVKIGDAIGPAIEKLQRLSDESKAFADAWRAWFKQRDRSMTCPDHPAEELKLDEAASISKSFYEKANKIVFRPCRKCVYLIDHAGEAEMLRAAGVPDNMHAADFENFEATTPAHKSALAVAKQIAQRKNGCLILLGKSNGVGKTHLAVATLRQFKRGGFITQARLMKEIQRNRFHTGTKDFVDWVDRCVRQPCLVLDELGLGTGEKSELLNLHEIIDERFGKNLPTILTSNCATLNELEPVLGFRIMDRLLEFSRGHFVLEGKSWRGRKKTNTKEK